MLKKNNLDLMQKLNVYVIFYNISGKEMLRHEDNGRRIRIQEIARKTNAGASRQLSIDQ